MARKKRKQPKLSELEQKVVDLLGKSQPKLDTKSVAQALEVSVSSARDALNTLDNKGVLAKVPSDTFGNLYFSTDDEFYTPQEIFEHYPRREKHKIEELLYEKRHQGISSVELARRTGTHKTLLTTLLKHFMGTSQGKPLLKKRSNRYFLTNLGMQMGADPKKLDDLIYENDQRLKKLTQRRPERTLDDYFGFYEHEQSKRLTAEREVPSERGGIARTLLLNELMLGSQYVDIPFLQFMIRQAESCGRVVVTGGIEAEHRWLQNQRRRTNLPLTLNERLDLFQKYVQELKRPVTYVLGDDDKDIIRERSISALKAQGKLCEVGVKTFNVDAIRHMYTEDMDEMLRDHWFVVYPYMLRAGRDVRSADVMRDLCGITLPEYQILLDAHKDLESGESVQGEVSKVIDLSKLSDSEMFRVVDMLRVKEGDTRIHMRHNGAYSSGSPYKSPWKCMVEEIRQLALLGEDLPDVMIEGHHEMFTAFYDNDVLGLFLPGMKNGLPLARREMHPYHTDVRQEKTYKQVKSRKEVPLPGAVILEGGKEQNYKLEIFNNKVKSVIESSQDAEEESHSIALWSDVHFGHNQERPELLLKFLDYAHWTLQADASIGAGDLINARNYRGVENETENKGRITLSSNVKMWEEFLRPTYQCPHVKTLDIIAGNHEDNTRYSDVGMEYLQPIISRVQGYLEGLEEAGAPRDLEASIYRKIITRTGDLISHPYFERTWAGYTVGTQHKYARFGGGSPENQMKKWLTNMGEAASHLDIVVGGHWHNLRMGMIADKLGISLGAPVGQSDFEFTLGVHSKPVMAILHLSNKRGVQVEIVTEDFLNSYQCVAPHLQGTTPEEYVRKCAEHQVHDMRER